MSWIKVNIKPEDKDRLDELVKNEGRHLYKIVSIMIDLYESEIMKAKMQTKIHKESKEA